MERALKEIESNLPILFPSMSLTILPLRATDSDDLRLPSKILGGFTVEHVILVNQMNFKFPCCSHCSVFSELVRVQRPFPVVLRHGQLCKVI
jgi:hypothetical protein